MSVAVMSAGGSKSGRLAAPFEGERVVFTGKLFCLPREAAQAKVRELGGETAGAVTRRTTMLVMGDEGFLSQIDQSRKLRTAERLGVRIVSETEFCGLAGIPAASDLKRTLYPLRDIRKVYPELREDRVRYLEAWGLIAPTMRTNADRFYDFPGVLILRRVHQQLAQGIPLRAVLRDLRADRAGQLPLEFADRAAQAQIIPFRPKAARAPDTADDWFRRGYELDGDPATLTEAREAYEKALELDPSYVGALLNLGNVHYTQDRLPAARACYERALQLDPTNAKARFNLANVLHDLKEYAAARLLYRDAVALDGQMADAHFYLALTCEKLGLVDEAAGQWGEYLALEPEGAWSAVAREHLQDRPEVRR